MQTIQNLEGACFKTGYEVLKQKGTVIVGMSPGNSYFKKDTIYNILRSVSRLFKNIKIFIPEVQVQYTYIALGKSITKAAAIARKNSNFLRNHSMRAIAEIIDHDSAVSISISNWYSEIEHVSSYRNSKKYIYDLYKKSEKFYSDVRQTTKIIVASQTKDVIDIEKVVDIAVNYLLEELAFMLASPGIYGVEQIAAAYHNRWPVFENLVSGQYDLSISNVGLVLLVE